MHRVGLDARGGGGAYFFRTLAGAIHPQVGAVDDETLLGALWDLTWAGYLTNDTLAPLRALLSGGRTAHRRTPQGPRRGRYASRPGALGASRSARPALPTRTGPPSAAGRWSLLPPPETDATVVAYATAELLLERYGVVTRGSAMAESVPGGFAAAYRVLAAAEESGRVRRGYFVEGLGAAQFATSGAVDRLRAQSRPLDAVRRSDDPPRAVVLAACDPANPFGAALAWPDRGAAADDPPPGDRPAAGTKAKGRGHQPGRKAGALVVLVDGELVLYVERGGKSLLTWTESGDALQRAADALALAVREGALGRLTVERTDGSQVLGSGHPVAEALSRAGFHTTPRGLRLRR